jgi:hypothetical protein
VLVPPTHGRGSQTPTSTDHPRLRRPVLDSSLRPRAPFEAVLGRPRRQRGRRSAARRDGHVACRVARQVENPLYTITSGSRPSARRPARSSHPTSIHLARRTSSSVSQSSQLAAPGRCKDPATRSPSTTLRMPADRLGRHREQSGDRRPRPPLWLAGVVDETAPST